MIPTDRAKRNRILIRNLAIQLNVPRDDKATLKAIRRLVRNRKGN